MKRKLAGLVVLFVLLSSSAFAVDFWTVECPANVASGANVTVKLRGIEHNEPFSVSLKRYAAVFMVNDAQSQTLGGVGVYGPTVKNLTTAIPVAAATNCDQFGNCMTDSFQEGPFSVILGAAPQVSAATLGMAVVTFISTTGEELAGGSCFVNITPALPQ